MNELQINVIETRAAVVNFNHIEISNYLDGVLVKYKGLVFTEATVSDCKKTIADLRKGQKSLDEFRIETKKKLTESVADFENQCKKLSGKIDEVINPLAAQQMKFETDRKEAKRKTIQAFIDKVTLENELSSKYASKLIIPDEYLNKGKSTKEIETELTALAKSLKVQQDKEAQDIDLIKTKVELANSKYQLSVGLADGAYLSLLAYKSVDEIVIRINTDAEVLQKREQKAKESIKVEQAPAPTPAPVFTPAPLPAHSSSPVQPMPCIPEMSKEVFEITANAAQFDTLEAFLNSNHYIWEYK
jgi:hypothetical protein